MNDDQDNKSVMGAETDPAGDKITFHFYQNCRLWIDLDTENINMLTLSMMQSTAKEMLIVLSGIYGMEDWECCTRFTKEQFVFLSKLAESKQIDMEDLLREIVQEKIDNMCE